jgi:toxin ParE1/3/4
MYKLKVSELAHKDLDNIVSYITVDLASPIAATTFLNEVEKCYIHLQNTPYMYAKCQNNRLKKESYRKVSIKNYLLVYKVMEEDKTVTVLRFFYGAQDYLELI